jgi:hypothetical protein
MMHMVRTVRVLAIATLWVVTLGAWRAAIALPERCPDARPATLQASAERAAAWFADNQLPDGRWRYRMDVRTGADLGGYAWVRHAGVLLALEQAGAREVADRGWDAALDRLRGEEVLRESFGGEGRPESVGGTALLVAAGVERRDQTGRTDLDELLVRLGRTLVGQVEPNGAVSDRYAVTTGSAVVGTRSPFTTGEVLFALRRLERVLPDDQWAATADRVEAYVTSARARTEGYVPDVSDHWSAYAFAERTLAGQSLISQPSRTFAARQAWVMSMQTRWESQRTNGGIDRWTRGRRTLGAGLGTIGEAQGAWWRTAAVEPSLASVRGDIGRAALCTAGMLAERQLDEGPAAGAWEQFGVTQMDDQQHALSAVLAAIPIAEAAATDALPKGAPAPSSWWLALAVVVVGAFPVGRSERVSRGGFVTGLALLAAALAGPPILDALDVSVGTALVGAGVAMVLGALVALLWRDSDGPPAVMPGAVLAAAACAAGGRTSAVLLAAALAVVIRPRSRWWATAVAAAAVALVMAGISAV